MLTFDVVAVICIIYLAFWIRLDYFFYPSGNDALLIAVYASPLLAIPIFSGFGLYREVIRFVSFKALWSIAQSATVYALVWGLIVLIVPVEGVPRSVILINWILVILVITSSRFFARWLLIVRADSKNVIIYGAGFAGRQLSTALNQSKEYNPVAFIDDSNLINNHSINGLKTYSPDYLQSLIDNKNVKGV